MNTKIKKKRSGKFKYTKGKFAVVKFYEAKNIRLFECIPDLWFANEDKTMCYWPPKSKQSPTLRAMNQDLPEDNWDEYECELISEGHGTYSIGLAIVREKTTQSYNTSSADEHIQAAKFRREHPGLTHNSETSFENIFAATKVSQVNEKDQSMVSERKTQETSNVTGNMDGKTQMKKKYVLPQENDSESRKSRSRSQSINSQPRSIRSHPRSVNSSDNGRENHEGNNVLRKENDSELSRKRYRSRSNHSERSGHSSQRDNNKPRSNRSGSEKDDSKPRSQSRSNRSSSMFSTGSSLTDNRSRSSANDSVSRSQSRTRSRHSHSKSSGNGSGSHSSNYESKSDKSQTRRVNSERNNNRSQIISHHSQSARKGSRSENRHRSSSHSSFRKTFHDKSENHSISRSSSSNARRKNDFNVKTNTKCHDSNHHRAAKQSDIRRNNIHASPRTLNRLRIEEMYRVHQRQRAANRPNAHNISTTPTNVRTVSRDLSPGRIDRQHHLDREHDSPESVDKHSKKDSNLLQTLLKEVREIKKIATKNERRFVENDRRLTKLEVTTNKTYIVLNDVSNAINVRVSLGNVLPRDDKPPKGLHSPKLPIKRLKELLMVNKDLKNTDFFNFLVNCEKEYCASSSSTDTATMTSYLRRFIDVDLRAAIVLKDLKGQQGMTLYNDFHNVYLFLVETMKAGYRIKNKVMTNNEVHIVLRTVWGRSKQTAEEANKRR